MHPWGTEGLKVTAVLRRKINQILIKRRPEQAKTKARGMKKIEENIRKFNHYYLQLGKR